MLVCTVAESYLKKIDTKRYFSEEELAFIVQKPIESLLARLALKLTLGSDISIKNRVNGAPYIPGREDFCSLSHSHGTGVAVYSKKKVGVDIEKIRKHRSELLQHISTEAEQRVFSEKDNNLLVTYIWTIKEAVLKTEGLGISFPMKNLKIKKFAKFFQVKLRDKLWYVKIKMSGDYVLALAVEEVAQFGNLNYKNYS